MRTKRPSPSTMGKGTGRKGALAAFCAAALGAGLLAACQSAPSPGREPVQAGNWTVETRAAVLVDAGVVR